MRKSNAISGSSRRNRYTSSASSRATTTVSSLSWSWASAILPAKRARIVSTSRPIAPYHELAAVETRDGDDVSSLICPSKNANSYRNRSIPLESAFAPGVEKADAEHQQKRQHLDEAKQAKVAKENRPRIEKHDLDVEENE